MGSDEGLTDAELEAAPWVLKQRLGATGTGPWRSAVDEMLDAALLAT